MGSLAELGGTRTTGIVRHIDELGRIVIPIEIRKRLGIGEKDPVEISVHGDTILLEKPHSVCVFCGSDAETRRAPRPVRLPLLHPRAGPGLSDPS